MRRPIVPFALFSVFAIAAPACGGDDGGASPAPGPTVSLETTHTIDPKIGTGGVAFNHGACFVGATAPNGMAKLGPDSYGPDGDVNFYHYSGYYAKDDKVKAFSHMHLHGTGATDYGVLGVLPLTAFDPAKRTGAAYLPKFDKATELASPGFYGLTFDSGVKVELTAAAHTGVHRYTFPGGERRVLIDLSHHLSGGKTTSGELHVDAAGRRITGKLHHIGGMSGGFGGYDVHFVIKAKGAFTFQSWSADEAPSEAADATGPAAGLVLSFSEDVVELAVGLSLVDGEGAEKNLAAEYPSFDFDGRREATLVDWKKLTDRMRPMGGSEAHRTIFKTALYHAFMMPSAVSDVDGRYVGPDQKVHTADGFRFMTDLSLWDTYRTLNPLYDWIAPEVSRDVVRSLHAFARDGGFYPKWSVAQGDSGTMLGASAEIVLADAYVKGVTDFPAEDAYQRARAAAADAKAPPGGRGGRDEVDEYMTLGYVSSNKGRSVSQTLEYAHDDFALGFFAKALGHADDAAMFDARRKTYAKLWDPASKAFRAKDAAGNLKYPTEPPTKFTDEYAEADGAQMVWMAPHDVEGLAAVFGGKEAMAAELEAFFQKSKEDFDDLDPASIQAHTLRPWYAAANEPVIHAPFLFAEIGRPELTQRWARWALLTYYAPTPDGLPGNDDGGTMSAWWIFASLGFYPLPGSDRYVVGSPLFPKVEVDVPSGGTFTVLGEGAAPDAPTVKSVTLDGAPLSDWSLRHTDLVGGKTLRFGLSK